MKDLEGTVREETQHGVFHQRNRERVARYLRNGRTGGDDYIVKCFPENSSVRLNNRWLQVALDNAMLDIVNSYLGLWGKLIYFDLWHTVPKAESGRIGSQYWHRDPEDNRMLKVYLYFNDVDDQAGAMQYVPGSCGSGRYRDVWRWNKPTGLPYASDAEIEKKTRPEEWITCSAPAGTIIFCDTSGLHRGGIASTGSRVLATWTFVTPASIWLRRFNLEPGETPALLSEPARFALT